jgi:hypothetical protein
MASGCLVLFGLPFLIAGIVTIGIGARRGFAGAPLIDWALPVIVGVAFASAGIGLILMARYGKRKLDEVQRLQAEHPDEPWMWDRDWASGRIRSAETATAVSAWIFAIMWNAVSAPVLFFLPDELDKGNWLALIGLLFPLIGVGFIVWAVRATARFRNFGTSELVLASSPAPLGGVLAGTIDTRLDAVPESMKLTLSCVRRVATSGRNNSTNETLLFTDERVIPGGLMLREATGTIIPFSFELPADGVASDRLSSPASVHWRLSAEAEVTGVDYSSRFELPVFRTDAALVEASRVNAVEIAGDTVAAREMALRFDPIDATIRIAQSPGGGTEFRFGAARTPGAALGITIVTAIFLGVAYGISLLGAPLLFATVFGFFGLVLLAITIDLWLTVTVVDIGNGQVRIRNSVLGIGRTKTIDATTIEDVTMKIGMSQNESAVQSAKAWYDVMLMLPNRKKVFAGRHIASKAEAEWVVESMKDAIVNA